MSNIRSRTYLSKSSVLVLDNDDEVELDFAACDWHEPLVRQIGDKLAVGYLVADEDCQHPLDYCDGMGKIIGRGKYQTRNHDESEMFEALGLNSYGDKDYDLAPVVERLNKAWNTYLESLSLDTLGEVFASAAGPLEDDGDEVGLNAELERLRAAMVDALLESDGVEDAIGIGVSRIGYTGSTYSELCNAATALDFDFDAEQDKAWEQALQAGEIGDVNAVVLDVYDHSGLHWSISGGGMQCRWDTSSGAGVWLPDAEAEKEIEGRTPVYAHAIVRKTPGCLRGGGNAYQLVQVTWNEAGPVHFSLDSVDFSDSWASLWTKAQAIAEGKVPTRKQLQWARYQAAKELAQQALDEYNAWLSGDCYGCVIETFQITNDENGTTYTQIDQDSCWGYVGSDWAKSALQDEFFDSTCANLEAELLAATTN